MGQSHVGIVVLLLLAALQLASCAATKSVLEATGDTRFGRTWKPPGQNSKGECDTSGSKEAYYLTVPFTAQQEAIHLVEALFAPEWFDIARVFVYTGKFDPEDPCTNLNATRTLDGHASFRIAMLLEVGDHTFVVSGVERGTTGKGGEGPFALRISAADMDGVAFDPQQQPVQWQPPVLGAHGTYNCSAVGNRTAYLGHIWPVQNTGAHDISVWLTGQPAANVHSSVYIFQGLIDPKAPNACAVSFHDAHKGLGHFNEFATVLLKNQNYTIVVVFEWETPPTTDVFYYGVQVAPSDRYSTNTSYAPYNVVADPNALPVNCTESGVLNNYQYIRFTAQNVLYFFDFIDAFDGNHTVLSVYEGSIGGSKTTPPDTCSNWLGTTRSFDQEPWRAHSLFLRLDVGKNYTVIVASAVPKSNGIFRPALFSGPSVNPTPPPTATSTHTTATTTAHTTTTHAAATTAATGSAATTGHPRHHSGMQSWQVALIVVGSLAGAGVIAGALAYYVLVVRKRPQYELIN